MEDAGAALCPRPSTRARAALRTLCPLRTLRTLCNLRAYAPPAPCSRPCPHPSQEVVSAIHLALLGGLLFSRSLLRWARREGYALPAAEDTVLDEVRT